MTNFSPMYTEMLQILEELGFVDGYLGDIYWVDAKLQIKEKLIERGLEHLIMVDD